MASILIGAVVASAMEGAGVTATAIAVGLATTAGSLIDSMWLTPLMQKSAPDQTGSRLESVRIQTAAEGSDIPYLHGPLNRVGGNVIWSSDLIEVKSTAHYGGKHGSDSTSFSYFVDISVGVCEPPTTAGISRITKIYANGKLFYDADSPSNGSYRYNSLTIHNGAEDQEPSSLQEEWLGTGEVPAYRGLVYVDIERLALEDFGSSIPQFNFIVEADATLNVGELIERLLLRAGFASEQFSIEAAINDPVIGLTLAGPTAVGDPISQLMFLYDIGVRETNGQLAFYKLTTGTKRQVSGDFVGARLWSPTNDPTGLTLEERDDSQYPYAVRLTYYDTTNEMQAGSLQQINQSTANYGVKSISLPMTLTPVLAKDAATKHLWKIWNEKRQASLTLPPSFIDVQEGDDLEIDWHGTAYTIHVTQILRGFNSIHEITGVVTSTTAGSSPVLYGGIITDAPGASVIVPESYTPPEMTWVLLDIAPLSDDDVNQSVMYLAQVQTTPTDTFLSSTLYSANAESGSEYTSLKNSSVTSTLGLTTSVLDEADGNSFYFTNGGSPYFDVELTKGSILSLEQEYVLDGANQALINDEIILFTTAELISANTYRLSGLLRGRRNTTIATHPIGSRFIILDANELTRITVPSTFVGTSKYYKLIGVGQTTDDTAAVPFLFNAQSRVPWNPVNIRGVRSGDDLVVTWNHRTRHPYRIFGTLLAAYDDHHFQIDVLDGATVVRSEITTTPSWEYSGSDQTTDFGAPQSSLTIRIYQVSSSLGAGPYTEETL